MSVMPTVPAIAACGREIAPAAYAVEVKCFPEIRGGRSEGSGAAR